MSHFLPILHDEEEPVIEPSLDLKIEIWPSATKRLPTLFNKQNCTLSLFLPYGNADHLLFCCLPSSLLLLIRMFDVSSLIVSSSPLFHFFLQSNPAIQFYFFLFRDCQLQFIRL